MTAAQENAIHAAQIQGDTARRNMAIAACNGNAVAPGLLTDIVNNDAVRIAAGQTIEWMDDAKMAAGMIPGTAGLTHLRPLGITAIPSGVKPPAKNG